MSVYSQPKSCSHRLLFSSFFIKLRYYKDNITTYSCTSENMGALQQGQVFWVIWENYQSPVANALKTAVSATPLLPELTPEGSYGAPRPLNEVKQSFILLIWHIFGGIVYDNVGCELSLLCSLRTSVRFAFFFLR